MAAANPPTVPDTAPTDVLDEEPVLRRAANARSIDELVQQERTTQDARLSALRRLRGDAALLLDPGSAAQAANAGLGARLLGGLGAALKRRRAPTEEDLRARYEEAQVRARRAAVFAEALAGLESELGDEVSRMRDLLVDLAHDERAIDALILRVRGALGDASTALGSARDGVAQRELEARVDHARARADNLDAQRDRLRTAEDRILHLLESERMLAERLKVLRTEVERAAQGAAHALDGMADQLRALATASDAGRVVRDLEGALTHMLRALEDSARHADDALAQDATASPRREP